MKFVYNIGDRKHDIKVSEFSEIPGRIGQWCWVTSNAGLPTNSNNSRARTY